MLSGKTTTTESVQVGLKKGKKGVLIFAYHKSDQEKSR